MAIQLTHNSPAPTVAALDLGTNNCRLLVARPSCDGFEVVDSFSRIVRLGEGVAASGRLAERAMARTIAALRVCAKIMARRSVGRARCVATEACRRASNGVEFLERVRRVTGLQLEIVDHEEEARLALLGCLPLVDPTARHVLLLDIGGGSTELIWLDRFAMGGPRLRCAASIPRGVVSLSEAFGADVDERGFEAMVGDVLERLAPIERRFALNAGTAYQRVQLIGTSGTVTTLAAIHLGLRRYERRRVDGLEVAFSDLDAVSRALRRSENRARAQHPCIGSGRADLVVAGCAILEAVHRSWPVPRLRVADRGLREGILRALNGQSLERALAAGQGW